MTDIPANKPSLRDDPSAIAEYLVQEHGLEGALDRAAEGTTAAHERGDNYGLSVWRDVKRLLRERGTAVSQDAPTAHSCTSAR